MRSGKHEGVYLAKQQVACATDDGVRDEGCGADGRAVAAEDPQ